MLFKILNDLINFIFLETSYPAIRCNLLRLGLSLSNLVQLNYSLQGILERVRWCLDPILKSDFKDFYA
jgi:hypothetical protein